MEKRVEATGRTIDDAIQNALACLNVDRDAVTVEVLEKAKSGFLGFRSTPAKVRVSYVLSRGERTLKFLEGLVDRMGMSAKIAYETDEEGNINYQLSGDNMGIFIGRKGDTLEALQLITKQVANNGEDSAVRVMVDAENYRARRDQALVQLAEKSAAACLKYGRNISLEPMNSYSRHVVHAALQDNKNVTTFSVGVEPYRKVIIAAAGSEKRDNRKRHDSFNRHTSAKPPQRRTNSHK